MATDIGTVLPQPLPEQHKRKVLLIWFAFAFIEGIADAFAQNLAGEGLYQMFSLFIAVLNTIFIVYWFVLDARERKFELNQKWIFGLVLVAVLVAPVYFVKTRGKGFWRPLLLAIACLFALVVCFSLGSLLAEFSGLVPAQPV